MKISVRNWYLSSIDSIDKNKSIETNCHATQFGATINELMIEMQRGDRRRIYRKLEYLVDREILIKEKCAGQNVYYIKNRLK